MKREPKRAYLPARFWRPSSPAGEAADRSLAVLIVAYRNPGLLLDCLASVERHLSGTDVHVWDNSGSRSAEMNAVVAARPKVRWHLDSTNIGFAAAVNSLAAEVPDQNLLLLNPDAVLLGPLTRTIAAVKNSGVAAAAPLVMNGEPVNSRSRPWDLAHREHSLVRALVSKSGYSHRLRGHRWSDLYGSQPTNVGGYLTGACLAISREAWDKIGPFDEEFFLYGEEDDWQRRARSAGWSLILTHDVGVAHTAQGTVANDPIAALRSRDLLRANVALNLELDIGRTTADVYLAGTSLLDRVQRSARRDRAIRRRPVGRHPSVVITTKRLASSESVNRLVLMASELDRRGYEVVIVCLERFGPMVANIPATVRVVRQPWWAPAIDTGKGASIVISGDTHSEVGFAMLWRVLGRGRRWLIAHQTPMEAEFTTCSRLQAAAIRRSDGSVFAGGERHDAAAMDGTSQARSFRPSTLLQHESSTDAWEAAISALLERSGDVIR